MNTPVLQFVHRGELVSLHDVPATRTLLQLLREDLGIHAVKEGCNEGDCGACTVVLGERHADRLRYRAVNSCLRLAHAIAGMVLWTAADLQAQDGTLHPVQQALLAEHASQCGFCTPGVAMSLFGLYQNEVCQGRSVDRAQAQHALSGNLCRCTGYRPILDAAQHMSALPPVTVDETRLLDLLAQIKPRLPAPTAVQDYAAPTRLDDLLAERAARPQAQLVAGGTDAVLWINKLHREVAEVIDLSRVDALRAIDSDAQGLRIGAAVHLTEAFDALVQTRPALHTFGRRFASLPIRNAGTLGGNVANGSPIGDSMPLLLALDAQLDLASVRGERTLPLASFYTGYRQNALAADEVLVRIRIPAPRPGEWLRVYKVSKRFEDDISAVCLAVHLLLVDGKADEVRIGVGGVAATPVRARQTEAALSGQPWNEASVQQAMATLRAEFQPISDLRASGVYRTELLGQLLQRFWRESQGHAHTSLDELALEDELP